MQSKHAHSPSANRLESRLQILEIPLRLLSRLATTAAANWRPIVATVTLSVAAIFTAYIVLSGKIFWDFAVYRAGIAAYQINGTPYDPQYLHRAFGLDLPFTYAPMVILVFAKISWLFTSDIGLALLVAAHLMACIVIPWLLLPRGMPRSEMPWLLGMFLTAFGLSGIKLFLTGNLAAIVSAVVLAALHYSVPRRNYTLLWLALLIICQVKIYFICFAAVPFLMERKIFVPTVACLVIIGTYALNSLLPPLLVHGFLESLASVSQITAFVGTSVLTAVQMSLLRLSSGHTALVSMVSWGVHGVFALLLLGFAAAVMWTEARPKLPSHLAPLWAFMAALLISPRLAPYELALLVIPLLIFLQELLKYRDIGLGIAIGGFMAGAGLVTTPLADWGGLLALLGVWFGIGVSWLRAAQVGAAPAGVTNP